MSVSDVEYIIATVDRLVTHAVSARNLGGTVRYSLPESAVQQTLSSTMSTTTSAAPSATTTAPPGTNPGGHNSPLLFFVALGFGVVFTNLWIIVGVKYCFRYNARARARANGQEDENVDLQQMPRPHRRRREKKLMTMDEVNERFPLIKYKAWRLTREQEGLPAAGGITAPPSRAPSIKNVETNDTLIEAKVEEIGESAPDTAVKTEASIAAKHLSEASMTDGKALQLDPLEPELKPTHTRTNSSSDEEEDDEDQIATAVPPEMLTAPGDTCAICIDNLEDDEDVRGLSCGHAFHASCLDPWLTSRRACCPLCKADYYVPKPRPEGELAPEPTLPRPNPRPPPAARSWTARAFRPRYLLPGHRADQIYDPTRPEMRTSHFGFSRPDSTQPESNTSGGPFRFLRRNRTPRVTPSSTVTPAQLEAGTR